MGKEISRIRLNRLYSESNIFEEISFHDGVNIILGEKYDDSSVKGRKTNGVGKSMSIEFLDFGFLNDYEKSRIAKIPKEVFPLEENVILDLDIGDEAITIKRNRHHRFPGRGDERLVPHGLLSAQAGGDRRRGQGHHLRQRHPRQRGDGVPGHQRAVPQGRQGGL